MHFIVMSANDIQQLAALKELCEHGSFFEVILP